MLALEQFGLQSFTRYVLAGCTDCVGAPVAETVRRDVLLRCDELLAGRCALHASTALAFHPDPPQRQLTMHGRLAWRRRQRPRGAERQQGAHLARRAWPWLAAS